MKARDVTFICDGTLPVLSQTAVTLLGGALHLWTVLQLVRLGGGVVLSALASLPEDAGRVEPLGLTMLRL
jgi:hypothetical protein